ncbi:MAG: bifunctional methylenetetrahydrofolate dehydrogenase/methenyltetrahydrofolate cyclohydrolase FolD [Bacteroidaceae bacterium]|nr:bifunctional methylenetetrahydrofolate dehydrogenase/methenyltetrahydrofolate cyclohydrolase FolD [Bacteroidaceae bacterium]
MNIDGKALSLQLKEKMKVRMPLLEKEYGRRPCLVVVIVGEDPASQSYVRGKIKAAAFVGMDSRLIELSADVTQDELLRQITLLNEDEGVDGILVQLPLPQHIDEQKVIDAIAHEKDVDGFHPLNTANLWLGRGCVFPCTPKGIMYMLRTSGIALDGKIAVVVGRSNIVGKPIAKMLLDADATVVMAHSHTKDLSSVTRQADVLVVAVGKEKFITADMVKPGAVVIDVGINRAKDGKLCGDVDFDAVAPKASHITPVPGGVGPMTIAMLLENTIECFENSLKFRGLKKS